MFARLRQTMFWKLFSSLKLTMFIIPAIVGSCIVGSLLPQETANRYVYYSGWFVGVIALLGLNTLVCMLNRATWKWSQATFILNHISILVIIAGAVVGGGWGFRGNMQIYQGEATPIVWVNGEKHPLEFSVYLKRFQVIYAGDYTHRLRVTAPGREPATVEIRPEPGFSVRAGDAQITVEAYYPDFCIGDGKKPMTRSDMPNNPALYLEVKTPTETSHQRLFARYPEFGSSTHGGQAPAVVLAYALDTAEGSGPYIDQFRSDVAILDASGKPVGEHRIEVNQPLRYGGYTFYQAGYDKDEGRYTVLQVSRDPGVALVYAGFAMLAVGMCVKYFFEKRTSRTGTRVHVRVAPLPERVSQKDENRDSRLCGNELPHYKLP